MTFRKALSLILALVMILSCVTLFTSCEGKNGDPYAKIPRSKRTHVYAQEELGIDSVQSYVSNIFTDGENIIMNYDVTYTIVRDDTGKEVERFEGYYYNYSNGVYEPIVYDYVTNDMFYTEEEVIASDDIDVIAVGEPESETDEIPETEPLDVEPFETPGEIPASDIAIEPVAPKDDLSGGLEGEPDEYGVITDENFNIQVPEGWWCEYTSENVFETVPLSGGESSKIKVDFNDFGDEMRYGYMSNMFIGNDGQIKVLYTTYSYDEETYISKNTIYVISVDLKTGEITDKKCLNDSFAAAGIPAEETYIYNIVMGSDGTFYFTLDGADIYAVDKDMHFLKKFSAGDGYISTFSAFDDKLFIGMYDMNYTKQSFKVFENGQFTPIPDDAIASQYIYEILGGSGNRIYYRQEDGIWYYDFSDNTSGEELNFINSDIDYLNIGRIIFIDDGKMIMSTTNWEVGSGETVFTLLTRVPEDQIKEEIIITVGSIWSDYNLIRAIMAYNKLDNGVRIKIKTYEKYNNEENDYNGASTQFNNEIISGSLPDIIMLDSTLPTQSYFQKGVFVDLNKYIDSEENGLNRDEYFDNILRAGEIDGHLYSLIAQFNICTIAAKTKYVGEKQGWTFDQMMEAIKKMPAGMEAFYGIGRNDILTSFLNYGMSGLVDWTSGNTKFDTQAFRDFITYLSHCPEKGLWQEYYDSMDNGGEYVYDEEKERDISEKMQLRFWNDSCLFYEESIGNFSSMTYLYSSFASRDLTMIGYPSDDPESNGAVIYPSKEFAISAKSPAKDQAWDFIKFYLNNDEQGWMFTLSRESVEKLAEQELEQAKMGNMYYYYQDYEWLKEMGYSEDYINFTMNSNVKLDQEMVDEVFDLIENASVVARSDSELTDIINEELSGFFAGTKTAEDTSRVIASRAKILISTKS